MMELYSSLYSRARGSSTPFLNAALGACLTCLHQLDSLKVATPVAEALALSIDQTVAIAVWANFGPTIVRYIEASQPLHVSMRMGTVMSILGTATGRAFAATLPRQQLEQAMLGALGDGPRRLDRSAVKDVTQEIIDIQAELRHHGGCESKGQVSHLAKSSKAELVFGNGKTLRMNTPVLFIMSPQAVTCANPSRVLRRSVG